MEKLDYSDVPVERLTHYLFRYPAKFHPPVVRSLIESYTTPGQTILDPFVGSGTLLVEAVVAGRNAVGVDVDPIAVAISRVKSRRYKPGLLREAAAELLAKLQKHERPAAEYEHRMFVDLSRAAFTQQQEKLARYIPAIPKIEHWFRRYVIIDLARILKVIQSSKFTDGHRDFFEIVFASIIRNSSNADPVPVSGLEVTIHMKRKDEEGRLVNPFQQFKKALTSAVAAAETFFDATDGSYKTRALWEDATRLERIDGKFHAVITSPPYQGAVDYYRRHKLEMFWLQQTDSQEQRLALLRKYIGRVAVAEFESRIDPELSPLAARWEKRIARISEGRARGFKHYITNMHQVFTGLTKKLPKKAPAIFIVGHSKWNGSEIPTRDLFQEMAGNNFSLDQSLFYPVKNRYPSPPGIGLRQLSRQVT